MAHVLAAAPCASTEIDLVVFPRAAFRTSHSRLIDGRVPLTCPTTIVHQRTLPACACVNVIRGIEAIFGFDRQAGRMETFATVPVRAGS